MCCRGPMSRLCRFGFVNGDACDVGDNQYYRSLASTARSRARMVPFKVGENQYYERGRGPNVWDYYFEPVSEYTTGAATLGGRPTIPPA